MMPTSRQIATAIIDKSLRAAQKGGGSGESPLPTSLSFTGSAATTGILDTSAVAGMGFDSLGDTSGGADALDTTAGRPEQSAANLRAIQEDGAITSVVEDRAQSSPTLHPVFAGILNGFRESAR
jgi:hypothetical protein